MIVTNWALDRIRPYAGNPRKNEQAVAKVAASLKEFGWRQPIVVDVDGVIVVGHTRFHAAKSLGWVEAPVHVADNLSAAQIRAYRLADNRTNEEAEWDQALLWAELEALKDAEFNVALTGFDSDEITALEALANATQDGLAEDDAVPALEGAPVSALGDLWILGNHNLLVGDATSVSAVERLMMGECADLVLTDPPYNVAYVGKTKAKLTIANDSMGGGAFYDFLLAVYKGLYLAAGPGAPIYVFHADSEGMNFRKAMVDGGFKLAQCCVWVKQTMVMGRQDYHWQHEPVLFGEKPEGYIAPICSSNPDLPESGDMREFAYDPEHETALYGWKPTAAHRWYSDRKQTTVWRFDRPQRNAEHPTMKPVALLEYPIANSSKEGDIVLDVFGGSGSTLIACEKTARRCRMMELDPRYADVIIRRWQEFTGRKAKDARGVLFDERAAALRAAA